jgi:Zn-dependent protease
MTGAPHFRLLGFPVRVNASSLILIAILGVGSGSDPVRLVVWVAIAFASILVHELGHALVGRAFGYAPAIEFHALGGVTHLGSLPMTPGRDVMISLAGPAVSLTVGFAAFALGGSAYGPAEGTFADLVLGDVIFANVGWGLFNACPILPLDGGHAFRGVLRLVGRGDPELVARVVSLVALVALAVLALRTGEGLWTLLFLANFAVANGKALRDHVNLSPAERRKRSRSAPWDGERTGVRGLFARMKLWFLRRPNEAPPMRGDVERPRRTLPPSIVSAMEEELRKRRPPNDKRFLN